MGGKYHVCTEDIDPLVSEADIAQMEFNDDGSVVFQCQTPKQNQMQSPLRKSLIFEDDVTQQNDDDNVLSFGTLGGLDFGNKEESKTSDNLLTSLPFDNTLSTPKPKIRS